MSKGQVGYEYKLHQILGMNFFHQEDLLKFLGLEVQVNIDVKKLKLHSLLLRNALKLLMA